MIYESSFMFVPKGNPEAPAMGVSASNGSGYDFEMFDKSGEAVVSTYHATFPDALRQVASALDRAPKDTKYELESY